MFKTIYTFKTRVNHVDFMVDWTSTIRDLRSKNSGFRWVLKWWYDIRYAVDPNLAQLEKNMSFCWEKRRDLAATKKDTSSRMVPVLVSEQLYLLYLYVRLYELSTSRMDI
jgi:hypothetical protein